MKDGASDLFVDVVRAEGKESCNGLNTAPGRMRYVGIWDEEGAHPMKMKRLVVMWGEISRCGWPV